MEEKNESGDSKKFSISKQIVAIVACCFAIASIIMIFKPVEYVGLICALIALVMGIIVFVKKLSGKAFAVLAILGGLVGGIFGGIITVSAMIATFGWGANVTFSYDCASEVDAENCQDIESDAQEDTQKIDEKLEEVKACLEEKGIDSEADYEDLAEEQQKDYIDCTLD